MKRIALPGLLAMSLGLFVWAAAGCGAKKDPVTPGPASGHTPTEILEVGGPAPGFSARDEQGNWVRLADFEGKKNVVLVFYPGDDTPGCTKQLCAIRDDWSAFRGKDVAVFGVNPADAASHQKFVSKYSFPFPLLVDRDQELARKYGCVGESHVERTVYGIDKTGRVVFAQRGMPDTQEILKAFTQ